MKADPRLKRLFLGAAVMLFAGIIYAWSVLKAPLRGEFGWNDSQLALNFTLTMCFFCIGGMAGSILSRRRSPRFSLTAAGVLLAAGLVSASLLPAGSSPVFLYLSFAVCAGTGIGIAYNTVIGATGAWFPDKKGTCSGVLMMCFGLSSFLLGILADALFQFSLFGWRRTYLFFGIGIGAVFVIASFGLRLPPQDYVFPEAAVRKGGASEAFEARDYTTAEAVRRPSFWIFFLYSVCVSAVGSAVISFARDLALSVGAATGLAVLLSGVLSICNGLGRVICGFVFDRIGRKRTMLIANLLNILAPGITLLAVLRHSLTLGVAGLCLVGIAYGFCPTISTAFVSAFYGMKHFASTLSIANLMMIPASFAATLSGALIAKTGGFVAPLGLLLGLACLALGFNLSLKKP